MNPHDYTPEQALELLLRRLDETAPEIAAQVRNAIAQGKEEEAILDVAPNRKKTRSYQQKVTLSVPEALDVAIQVLRAHFVEMPLFVNSAHENFALASVSNAVNVSEATKSEGMSSGILLDETKEIEIEIVPETALNLDNRAETMILKPLPEDDMRQQLANLRRVEELFQFDSS